MTRVRCRQSECIFWEGGTCTAEEIELDPEQGCLSLEELEDIAIDDGEELDEDFDEDWDEWDEDWVEDDEEIGEDEYTDWDDYGPSPSRRARSRRSKSIFW